jgi:hypothetical protein
VTVHELKICKDVEGLKSGMADLEEGKRALAMLESWPKDSVTTGLNVHTEPCMRLHLHIRCSFSFPALCLCLHDVMVFLRASGVDRCSFCLFLLALSAFAWC